MSLLGRLLRAPQRLQHVIYWERFLDQQMKREVRIARGARIYAADGITLGAGTRVQRDATISACAAGLYDRLRSRPNGRVTIGEQCEILPYAMVAAYGGSIDIGHRVSINPFTILYGHGGLVIGDDTRIAAHTVIIPANHRFDQPDVPIRLQPMRCEGIRIGRDVWIGAGARILDGVTIADHAVIAAGAVVTRDVDCGIVAGGVPARPIGRRDRLDLNRCA